MTDPIAARGAQPGTEAGPEAVSAAAAPKHQPGDHHRYRIECEVCGQVGTIRLSVDPDREPADELDAEELHPAAEWNRTDD